MARIVQPVPVRSRRGTVKGVPVTLTLTATASGQTQVNLSWAPPAGVIYQPATSYQLDRSTDQSNWTSLLNGSTATTYADTGRTAGTTYYYRLRGYDGVTYGAYATANATTQAAPVVSNAVMNTRFAGVALQTIPGAASYRVTGTDSVTGQVFTTTSPRLWGGTEWTEPRIQVGDAQANWTHQLLTGVNGPGGTNNETVLRITRTAAFTANNQQSPYQIFPSCTVAQMGMVYVRLKIRATSATLTNGSTPLFEYKTGRAGETSDRKIQVSAARDSGLGWCLLVLTNNANSSQAAGSCWGDNVSDPPATSTLFAGDRQFFKGLFEPYTLSGAAPSHDWRRWATLEVAFRLHSTNGQVAGNAAQGWTWVATSLGSTTAAVANGGGTQRFYIPGPNVWDVNLENTSSTPSRSGVLFPWNHYGAVWTTGVGMEIGSVEVYESWPSDASAHPAGAV